MTTLTTFYLSRILGNKVLSESNIVLGKMIDLVVDVESIRPKVIAAKIIADGKIRVVDFSNFCVDKEKGQYTLKCSQLIDFEVPYENTLFLVKNVLDKQIVDIDGKKLVKVNDLRLAILSFGACVVAVDVGLEGRLRRVGLAKPLKQLLKVLGKNIPSKLILWDDVEAIDFAHEGIKLAKPYSKLLTLHPSDLADIIEDLDREKQLAIFASMDDEKAADVLEELEQDAQVSLIEYLSVEKAADLLEKMPADEIADILDEIEDTKAEKLLNEMDYEVSEEVRELMEYDDDTVGSIMATDFIAFNENLTVEEAINILRKEKPESDTIYYLYVLDGTEKFIGTISLRDLIVSLPQTKLNEIMKRDVIHVSDDEKVDSLAEIISKYSLLAIPVVDKYMKMMGVVVIDDVIFDLLKRKKKRT